MINISMLAYIKRILYRLILPSPATYKYLLPIRVAITSAQSGRQLWSALFCYSCSKVLHILLDGSTAKASVHIDMAREIGHQHLSVMEEAIFKLGVGGRGRWKTVVSTV